MKVSLHKAFLLLLITFTGLNGVYSQNLIKSKRVSPYTYIYKITNEEARTLYKNNMSADTGFLHHLIDSFPTGTKYKKQLPPGHYLKSWLDGNKHRLEYASSDNFHIFILNNHKDFCIQIRDLQGNIIDDAEARIRYKKLRFNPKTQCFTDKKSNQKGLLAVTWGGHTAYYSVNRRYNNTFAMRALRIVLWRSPATLVWRPVRYAVLLPIDAVRSIGRYYPVGTLGRTVRFAVKAFETIACWFDDYYCDYDYEDKFDSYLVFNKPKYRPGDTVKVKAFIAKKGRPFRRNVKVTLNTEKGYKTLSDISPYRKGAYRYEFVLHDSLNLKLDKKYKLGFGKSKWKHYLSGQFKYEDYELKSIRLALDIKEKQHYRGKRNVLTIKATDENELPLKDAEADISIVSEKLISTHNPTVFIPNTLWEKHTKLKPDGKTEIEIPEDIFPKANFKYTIKVSMRNSENEERSDDISATYFYFTKKPEISLINDSLHFRFLDTGLSVEKEGKITGIDPFGLNTTLYEGPLPHRLRLNPIYAAYRLQVNSLDTRLNVGAESAELNAYSSRSYGKTVFGLRNPRRLHFTYDIFKKNRRIASGYGDSLHFEKTLRSKKNLTVTLRYIWAGQVEEESYAVNLKDKALTVETEQDKVVFPGKESTIKVKVSDYKGKPVKNADVTAYALTDKFDYSPPAVPYMGKKRGDMKIHNNFRVNPYEAPKTQEQPMHLNRWKRLAEIDSVAFYQFLFPGDSIYRFSYPANGSLTQFAPYFTDTLGNLRSIHMITVDNKVLYLSMGNVGQPYSFAVSSGYHQIELRTARHSIQIDSLYISKGQKHIFSLSEACQDARVQITKEDKSLSQTEQYLIRKYLAPYRKTFGEDLAYIRNYDRYFKLSGNSYPTRGFVGPVAGSIEFTEYDDFNLHFRHEPGFEYEFLPKLLKMRSLDNYAYPLTLTDSYDKAVFDDSVLSRQALIDGYHQEMLARRRLRAIYRNPETTTPNYGQMLISTDTSFADELATALNTLLFKYEQSRFLRIYPGFQSKFEQLDAGYYKLIYFYPESQYQIYDSLFVQTNGRTIIKLPQERSLRNDAFGEYVDSLIQQKIYHGQNFPADNERDKIKIRDQHQRFFNYSRQANIVEGYVQDEEGMPMPGVSVVAKNSTIGTISDINGRFSLNVPSKYSTLIFGYIGMETQERLIPYDGYLNVTMIASSVHMDEVVVTALGRKKSAYSTVSVKSYTPNNVLNALQGRVAGVSITSSSGVPGTVTQITIRGAATYSFDSQPLYIINGIVYTGDFSKLDPNSIQNIEVLKGEQATAIYGSKAAGGVVILEIDDDSFKEIAPEELSEPETPENFYAEAGQSQSLRENFSDYAFWQPALTTDENGMAEFTVRYPDDITRWRSFFLVTAPGKKSGQTEFKTKSYKPLAARLSVPRFLIACDSACIVGKALNYMPDSVSIERHFEINGTAHAFESRLLTDVITDRFVVAAIGDTLQAAYMLETADGYFDGELRKIPIYPQGLEKTEGVFVPADKDTTFSLSFKPENGPVQLYARADMLDVIDEEISRLIHYQHNCNEQMASKLKALLTKQVVKQFKKERFTDHRKVKRLIRLIEKNQNSSGLWGWWGQSEGEYWISMHVTEALLLAESAGYKVSFDKMQAAKTLSWDFQNTQSLNKKLEILSLMLRVNPSANYSDYLANIEEQEWLSPYTKLKIMALKQASGLEIDLKSLNKHRKETLFGNYYYGSDYAPLKIMDNEIRNTLLAYRILANDTSANHTEELRKMRNFFLEKRAAGHWTNTYESAQIIETILPELLDSANRISAPILTLSGDTSITVSEFPFAIEVQNLQTLNVHKTGSYPVYFTAYQQYWEANPESVQGDFEITSYFEDQTGNSLTAGEKVQLTAELLVNKEAEYVMISIPIPAGCSYHSKPNRFKNEVHREYYRDKTNIFCRRLAKGKYRFTVELMPRYYGTYTLNPAKAELMYFPTFNANNKLKNVIIQ